MYTSFTSTVLMSRHEIDSLYSVNAWPHKTYHKIRIYIFLISYKIECFRLLEVNLSGQTKISLVNANYIIIIWWLASIYRLGNYIIKNIRYIVRFSVHNTLYSSKNENNVKWLVKRKTFLFIYHKSILLLSSLQHCFVLDIY